MSETQTPVETPQTSPAAAEQPKPQPPAEAAAATSERKAPEPDYKDRFEAQQKVNRDLESKFNSLRDGIKTAFGIEPEKGGEGDLVTTLQQRVSQMERNSLVDQVARRHGITADDDVAFLRGAPDETAMTRLAERLKASNTTPTSPAPDPSQASAPMTPEAQAAAAYEAFYPSKT